MPMGGPNPMGSGMMGGGAPPPMMMMMGQGQGQGQPMGMGFPQGQGPRPMQMPTQVQMQMPLGGRMTPPQPQQPKLQGLLFDDQQKEPGMYAYSHTSRARKRAGVLIDSDSSWGCCVSLARRPVRGPHVGRRHAVEGSEGVFMISRPPPYGSRVSHSCQVRDRGAE